jgi:hypothetical protein
LALTLALALAFPVSHAQTAPHPVAILTYLADNGTVPPLGLQDIPTTVVDGVLTANPAPEGNPASAFAHERELQRLLDERAAVAAPVTLTLDGNATGVAVGATSTEDLGNVTVHVVLFDDGRAGQRFVALQELPPASVALSPGAPVSFDRAVAAPPNATRLGFVAYVVTTRAVGTFAADEVVQAASWTLDQGSPTRAAEKTILVQHSTATWCEPCQPSDQALDLIAGASESPLSSRSYALPPTPLALVGLVGGAAVGVLLLRRRDAP